MGLLLWRVRGNEQGIRHLLGARAWASSDSQYLTWCSWQPQTQGWLALLWGKTAGTWRGKATCPGPAESRAGTYAKKWLPPEPWSPSPLPPSGDGVTSVSWVRHVLKDTIISFQDTLHWWKSASCLDVPTEKWLASSVFHQALSPFYTSKSADTFLLLPLCMKTY